MARAARAGQPFSRSQSRNPLLKRKRRGGWAGASWLEVPGAISGGTVRPLLQLPVPLVGSARPEGSRCHLHGAAKCRREPQCPFLWGSMRPQSP